ncbi:MAG: MFS transporter [Ilumatobacteraceae bacterium]|nr:MFS transporter [Ilumatobacteraceae bacterium]
MTDTVAPVPEMTHRQRQVIIIGLMTGLLLAALDGTIVATALPTIVGEFGGIDRLSWVVTAYLVASTTSMPLFGKISDLYGRKRVYQAAIIIFIVASVLCGASQNIEQLIAFRALQGIGGGGLFVLTFTIVGDIVPARERGRYQGYLSSTFALASVLGPLAGGFITDELSWRWVFYVNLPVGIAALVATTIVLKLPRMRTDHSLDIAGSVLLVTSIVACLLATVWASTEYGWSAPSTIILYLLSILTLVAFIAQERRAPEPVLPLRMFNRAGFGASVLVSFLAGAAMFGSIVYLPLFFQGVQGKGATNAGLLLLPLMLSLTMGSLVTGRLTTYTGRYRIYPIIGTPIATLGLYLLSTIEPSTSRLESGVYMVIMGFGIGMVLPVLTLAIQNTVEARDLGAGTAAANFFRTLGGTLGVAILGTILNSQLNSGLDEQLAGIELPGGVAPADLAQDPTGIASLPDTLRDAVTFALSDAVTFAFLIAAFVMLAAFVVSFFIREVELKSASTTTTMSEQPAEPSS